MISGWVGRREFVFLEDCHMGFGSTLACTGGVDIVWLLGCHHIRMVGEIGIMTIPQLCSHFGRMLTGWIDAIREPRRRLGAVSFVVVELTEPQVMKLCVGEAV
jgi:hypothetical protein